MAEPESPPTSRRSLLAAGIGALAGLAAGALGRPLPIRAAGDPLILGTAANASAATTGLVTTAGNGLAATTQDIAGRGLVGFASNGAGSTYGVWGESASATGTGVYGESTAEAGQGNGVVGITNNPHGMGVFGRAVSWGQGSQVGVFGEATSPAGFGVRGRATSNTGYAVGGQFETAAKAGAALIAIAPEPGIGLKVTGRVVSNRAKKVTVKTGTKSVKVSLGGITTSTLVVATIQGRKPGFYVASVYPQPGYFIVYLNKAATSNITVGYVVLN